MAATFRTLGRWGARALAALLLASSGLAAAAGGTLDTVELARAKLSPDLLQALTAVPAPVTSWVHESADGRLVKVLIVGDQGANSDLKDLRREILDAGGSVYYRYISLTGVSAMLPAAKVIDIARRKDVVSVSPNRPTSRTASFLETVTGAGAVRAGTSSAPAGLDGSGVGIAFLDSGIMSSHRAFADKSGASRVKRSVALNKVTEVLAPFWARGVDISADFFPGSATLAGYETIIDNSRNPIQDAYGHGTAVAAVAGGRGFTTSADATGVAPGANLYDLRVLDENGVGEMGDALAAIDWIVFHAEEYGIRVINISLSADSTESYKRDPLCIAVRNAVAAGLTVVVAAGNYGLAPDGRERLGSIGSPGIEPSAITVGSSNSHATTSRADDTVNFFSSRGPTRGGLIDAAGVRHPDNILKPDLVAPGNAILTALAKDATGTVLNKIVQSFPQLVVSLGGTSDGAMIMSGTSIAAPVVSGTVAVLLQANPGLTPPIIKAMLQYTAEPLQQHNLLQQGAGLVNVAGAVQMANAIIPDLSALIGSKVKVGSAILVPGKAFPLPQTTLDGHNARWSRFVYMGGQYLFAGEDLFRKFQALYDPQVSWVKGEVLETDIDYFKGQGHDYITGFRTAAVNKHGYQIVTAGVKEVTPILGPSSSIAQTGAFTPSGLIADKLAAGAGIVMAEGVIMAEGIIMVEGAALQSGTSNAILFGEP